MKGKRGHGIGGALAEGQRNTLHGAASRPPAANASHSKEGSVCLRCCQKRPSAGLAAELPWNDPCLSKAGFAPQNL